MTKNAVTQQEKRPFVVCPAKFERPMTDLRTKQALTQPNDGDRDFETGIEDQLRRYCAKNIPYNFILLGSFHCVLALSGKKLSISSKIKRAVYSGIPMQNGELGRFRTGRF